MEKMDYQNQTYIIEEKTGKIVKVEDVKEKQKQQKKALQVKIAALCTAIGISGIGIIALDHYESEKDNQVAVENIEKEIMSDISDFLNEKINNTTEATEKTETVALSRDELLQGLINSGLTEEEAKKQIHVVEEKAANEQGLHTEAEYNEMISAIDQGISREEQRELANQQLSDYNEATNYIYQEEKLINGEWVKGDMVVTNGDVPQSSIDKRYIFVGPSFEKIQLNPEFEGLKISDITIGADTEAEKIGKVR